MRKLFFAICFNFIFVCNLFAKVTPISGYEGISFQNPNQQGPAKVHEVDAAEFKDFLEQRFSEAQKIDVKDLNKNFSIVRDDAEKQKDASSEKSIFENLYEQALSRLSSSQENAREEIVSTSAQAVPDVAAQEQSWQQQSNVPMIVAYLPPNNTPEYVPAMEHIPYFMSLLEVLPSGMVKITETVTVVANGYKLKKGLSKKLPLYVNTVSGKRQKLDYSIISVTANDMPISYHLNADNNNVYMLPEQNYILDPGVYTYKFEYVVDNLLYNHGDYYQLYWDIGGNGWNLVVDRAGGILVLPQKDALIDSTVLLGGKFGLYDNLVSILPNGPTSQIYMALRPLFVSEGLHLIADISPQALLPETLWQKTIRGLYGYGDICFAVLGLLVITISFLISWRYIGKDKGQLKFNLEKSPLFLRQLLFNRFDMKSVCGFLLEAYRKNIIDIQQSRDTILLIKRTDNMGSLTHTEQKALGKLFTSHETVFRVCPETLLKFKRFISDLHKDVKIQMLFFRFKINIGYLMFGTAMLLLTEAFISALKYNFAQTFTILFLSSILSIVSIFLWYIGTQKLAKYIIRTIVVCFEFLLLVVMSAVIHPFAAILLLASAAIIVLAIGNYSQRFGLMKHYIKEAGNYRNYLLEHHDSIILGKGFINHQAAIWALDLSEEFKIAGDKEYYKIPVMQSIVDKYGN